MINKRKRMFVPVGWETVQKISTGESKSFSFVFPLAVESECFSLLVEELFRCRREDNRSSVIKQFFVQLRQKQIAPHPVLQHKGKTIPAQQSDASSLCDHATGKGFMIDVPLKLLERCSVLKLLNIWTRFDGVIPVNVAPGFFLGQAQVNFRINRADWR